MKRSLIISATLLYCIAIGAQNNNNTLKDCLERGLKNNYSLRIIRNQEEIAKNNKSLANAGILPTVEATAGYSGTLDNTDTTPRDASEKSTQQRNITDHTLRAGIDLQWTIFNGFKMQADYNRLKELSLLSQTQTRIAVEDFIAEFTAEYYNYIQQRLRLKNLNYAVRLSRERMRIVQDRYIIGDNSRLDLLQARVDFNADSADCMKQEELLITSRIRLYELMAERNTDINILANDTVIYTGYNLNFNTLWEATLANNVSLIESAHNRRIADLELKSIRSRDYPYLKLNAGYGYTQNRYETGNTKERDQWGADFGLTLGFKLFDGKRSRERRNARIAVQNAALKQENLELELYAELSKIWQAYENNRRLLMLERQNILAARENYDIAYERYLMGDLSGIEMREAQQSMFDAEERILVAEYNTKLCEISLLQISGKIDKYLE
ncbi:MAG: TolC family protein [Bacteroidaceae bacterium]|nr:TolC family protein [Bacteroidaceae bacterium]